MTRRSLVGVRWPLTLVLLAACSSGSSSVASTVSTTTAVTSPSDTTDVPVATAAPRTAAPDDAVVPAGFERGAAVVTEADGTTCELCVWLATTSSARARGLMEVTDLGAADAMAFVYPDAHTGSFWMKDTVLPLSIAFFAPDGSYLDAFDMEPCVTDDCISYPTPADFLIAVEVPRGGLAELGIAPGATLELLDAPCTDP